MKKAVAVISISIFSIVTAAILFSDHSGGHHGRSNDCILSAFSVMPCPEQQAAVSTLLFHLTAIKQIFLAVTEWIPIALGLLVAAGIFHSIYDKFFRILENLFIKRKTLRLRAVMLRHPYRAEFLNWFARSCRLAYA